MEVNDASFMTLFWSGLVLFRVLVVTGRRSKVTDPLLSHLEALHNSQST